MAKSLKALQAEHKALTEDLAKDPENEELQTKVAAASGALDAATKAADTKHDQGKVEVRVLNDHQGHKTNDVIRLGPDDARDAVTDGWADNSVASIEYAKSLASPA
ncbi:hypothetical protein BH10PSE12_BH10PSE12_02770 [soil metagenome]